MSDTDTDTDTVEEMDNVDDLEDELFLIGDMTRDDGRVEAVVEDYKRIERVNEVDKIKVWYRLPTGKTETEVMDFPQRDDPTFKFVSLCRFAGTTLSAAGHLKGSTVLAELDENDDWELYTEPWEPKKSRKIRRALMLVQFVLSPGMVAFGPYWIWKLDQEGILDAENTPDRAAVYFNGILAWLLIVGTLAWWLL